MLNAALASPVGRFATVAMLALAGAAAAQERPSDPPGQDQDQRRASLLRELESTAAEQRRRLLQLPAVETRALDARPEYRVDGTLTARYRLRGTGDARDQDVVSLLAADLGDSSVDRVTGRFYGRMYADLDGAERDSTFRGLDQSRDEDVDLRLYEAYVDVHHLGPASFVRLGRQNVDETGEEVRFDGVRADLAELGPAKMSLSLYGGIPAHLYESSTDGDLLGGVGLVARPWRRARARLDWVHAEDRTPAGDLRNDLLAAALWQGVGESGDLYARYTWLEGDSRDVTLRGRGEIAGVRTLLSFFELFSTQRRLVTEFDPFFLQTSEYRPYRQVGVVLDRDLGDHLVLAGGADVRRLSDASDEAQFNREFTRLFLNPVLHDVWLPDLSLGLVAELWDSSGEDITTFGGDLEARPTPALTAGVGTSYNLFKLDLFTGQERDHVRTWYARLDCEAADDVTVGARYEFERNDIDEFHTLRIRVTCKF